MAVAIISINIFSFLQAKLFPILWETMCMHGVMYMYAVICTCGAIFIAIVIKETKGQNLDEVVEKS